MFAESLLESAPHVSHRSGWMKLASALVQSAALAVLLAIPLFHVERLRIIPPVPSIRMTRYETPVTTQSQTAPHTAAPTTKLYREIVQPSFIPRTLPPANATTAENPVPGPALGCLGSCASPVGIPSILNTTGSTIDVRPPHRPAPLPRVSEVQLGDLVRKVLPEYPPIAKAAHVQGAVVLTALVGKDGRVERVRPLSGPQLLIGSAIRAVEQWQYRPYILNHEPIEVQTQITVNFVLNRD